MNLTRTKNRLQRLIERRDAAEKERNIYADHLEAFLGLSLYHKRMGRDPNNELVYATDPKVVGFALHVLPGESRLHEMANNLQVIWIPWSRPEFGGIQHKDRKRQGELEHEAFCKRLDAVHAAEKVYDTYSMDYHFATKYGGERNPMPVLPEGYPPYPTKERMGELRDLIDLWQKYHVQYEDLDDQIEALLNDLKSQSWELYQWVMQFAHENGMTYFLFSSRFGEDKLKALPDDEAREALLKEWRDHKVASFIESNGPTEEGLVNPKGAGAGAYIQADCGCIYRTMSDKQVIQRSLRQGQNPESARSGLYPYMKLAVPSEKCREIYYSRAGGFPRWGSHDQRIGAASWCFDKEFRVVEKPPRFDPTPTQAEKDAQGYISRARS